MLRFGNLLSRKTELSLNFETCEFFPRPLFSRTIPNGKFFKWAAYLDKYFLFPRQLNRKLKHYKNSIDLVHVVDHSNAIYLPKIKKISTAKLLVTCHDLIAVRTALGEFPSAPNTSPTGKRLQGWIRSSLNFADHYSCDSNQTKNDLNRLIPKSTSTSSVIHLGTEPKPAPQHSISSTNKKLPFDPNKTDFILHVGSSAWYKNRKAVFRSFVDAHEKNISLNLKLVLVGPEPQSHELDHKVCMWISNNKSSIIRIDALAEESLYKLYQNAKVLIFPSHIEGFGWPPLEAALCGCPVITTHSGAIHELLGSYPKYVDSTDQNTINRRVLESLQSNSHKRLRINLPNGDQCRKNYYELYERMLDKNS